MERDNKPENPLAFPRPMVGSDQAGTIDFGAVGMTLRDYFAAKALQGWRANPNGKYTTYIDAAKEAYEYADAMLEAREP